MYVLYKHFSLILTTVHFPLFFSHSALTGTLDALKRLYRYACDYEYGIIDSRLADLCAETDRIIKIYPVKTMPDKPKKPVHRKTILEKICSIGNLLKRLLCASQREKSHGETEKEYVSQGGLLTFEDSFTPILAQGRYHEREDTGRRQP